MNLKSSLIVLSLAILTNDCAFGMGKCREKPKNTTPPNLDLSIYTPNVLKKALVNGKEIISFEDPRIEDFRSMEKKDLKTINDILYKCNDWGTTDHSQISGVIKTLQDAVNENAQ